MGPLGVGKTFVATALGQATVRRRHPVRFERFSIKTQLRTGHMVARTLAPWRDLLAPLPAARTALFANIRARRAAGPLPWLGHVPRSDDPALVARTILEFVEDALER